MIKGYSTTLGKRVVCVCCGNLAHKCLVPHGKYHTTRDTVSRTQCLQEIHSNTMASVRLERSSLSTAFSGIHRSWFPLLAGKSPEGVKEQAI